VSRRPTVNNAVSAMEGYHSPQLDVDIRLNTNESPLPPPEAFTESVLEAVRDLHWNRYPDRGATELHEALAGLHGCDPEMIFAANGSNEVLQTLLMVFGGSGRSAAVFEPTYALHSHIAKLLATDLIVGQRLDDFTISASEVDRVMAQEPDVVFLCSPNNPTGMVETRELVSSILDRCADLGSMLVVDEAYGQFAHWSAVELIGHETPLLVTRTYSKTWAMAGARLGYGIAPAWAVAELEKAVLPYHLDAVKQAAGVAALRYEVEMEERVAELIAQRQIVTDGLSSLAVEQWASGANFVLFRPLSRPGEDVWQALVERSILVRNCGSWPRLAGCLRVTIGSDQENRAFLAALTEILEP
jgi:histidinol-phosphate aminotransferase